jgi:zinc transport system permease protein
MSLSFWSAVGSNPFLQLALLAGFIASLASGIVGSYVVVKRIAFISGSISHSVLGGMGLFLWLERVVGWAWLSPLAGAIVAAILSALIIGWVHISYRQREDSVIAGVWAIGMAVGIIFVALTPGFNVDMTSFLLGNILWTTPADLITLAVLDAIVLLTVLALHRRLLALCFDEDQAVLQGVPVRSLYLLLLTLVALTVVLLVQVVGIVLVLTMLTIPPTIAGLFVSRLSTMMVLAIVLGILFSWAGTWLSYDLDWPIGATIALLSGVAYLVVLPVRRPVA